MKSRTSFFNLAVFRKDLIRCIPLIVAYTAFWLLLMPIRFASGAGIASASELIDGFGNKAGSIANLFYSIAIAMVLYSYLFTARSANMIHAFPVRREGLFLTHTAAGLVCSFGPNLLIALLSILSVGSRYSGTVLLWCVLLCVQFVCAFGFASFLAQLTGQIIALPILYFILNFAVVIQELILRQLLASWVFGLPYRARSSLSWLSPVVYIWMDHPGLLRVYYPCLLAAGVLFLLFGMLLYRNRKIECAGDVIAIPVLRPIAQVLFTAGCAIVLGFLITLVVDSEMYVAKPGTVAVSLVIGAFFGYFGSAMALKRKINVFKKEWLGFGVAVLCILAVLAAARFDLFGYSRSIPDPNDIAGVYLGNTYQYSGSFADDAETIQAVHEMHEVLVQDRSLAAERYYGSTYQISYQLRSGKIVSREYRLSFDRDTKDAKKQQFNTLFEKAYTRPKLRILRICPDELLTRKNVTSIYFDVHFWDEETGNTYDSFYASPDELIDLYYDCIEPDVADGYISDDGFHNGVLEDNPDMEQCIFTVQFCVDNEYYYYNVDASCIRSYPACKALYEKNGSNQDEEAW